MVHDLPMSFDLVVLAMQPGATLDDARRMAARCRSADPHPEGELDERIVAFYQDLQQRYPDHPPYPDDSPWSSAPLDAGIDHITAYTRYGPSGAGAVDAILELALRHGLVVYDPQFDCIEPDESDDDYA
jgi:hypothetical protein